MAASFRLLKALPQSCFEAASAASYRCGSAGPAVRICSGVMPSFANWSFTPCGSASTTFWPIFAASPGASSTAFWTSARPPFTSPFWIFSKASHSFGAALPASTRSFGSRPTFASCAFTPASLPMAVSAASRALSLLSRPFRPSIRV